MARPSDRTHLRGAVLALALLARSAAAPFTPGNIIVATAPTGGDVPAAITIAEYTPSFGPPAQTYVIPASGSPPIGSTQAGALNTMQIAFAAGDNQTLYVGTTWTNVSGGSKRCGFVRVSAAGPALAADAAWENGIGPQACRGVAAAGGFVFSSSGDGTARSIDAAAELYFPGNALWLEAFAGQLYVSTSSMIAPFAGPGIYRTGLADPAPAALSLVFAAGPELTRPLGFVFANASTAYVAVYLDGGGLTAGLYKWTLGGGTWTGQGRLAAIPGAVYDVEAVVSGGTATLYAITDTAVWKLTDTLTSTGAAWTGAAASAMLSGLARGRSLAAVPTPAVPACPCAGDLSGDSRVNGADVRLFVSCMLGVAGSCACGDFNNSSTVTAADIGPFVTRLLTFASCP